MGRGERRARRVAVTALAVQAVVNLAVLVFNLLPVYPLDGGQLLHPTLWRLRSGSVVPVTPEPVRVSW